MEPRLPPEPAKLLSAWMEWEKGETSPGRVMSNLKIGGMREVLESLVAQAEAAAAAGIDPAAAEVDAAELDAAAAEVDAGTGS